MWTRRTRAAAATVTGAFALALPASATAEPPVNDVGTTQGVVTDIRTGQHATFDRLVVQFRRATPTSTVTYKKVLRSDGSGERVELKGRKNLLVHLEPARAHTAAGQSTLPSNGEVVRLPEIREWRLLGDFEGVVTIGIGVRHKHPVSVTFLRHPRRLVIDVAH